MKDCIHRSAMTALALFITAGCLTNAFAQTPNTAITAAHNIGSAKLIIGDVEENQTFWKKVFDMREVSHYNSKDAYDEPIMGFESGARLALFHPLGEAPLAKSQFPVALI